MQNEKFPQEKRSLTVLTAGGFVWLAIYSYKKTRVFPENTSHRKSAFLYTRSTVMLTFPADQHAREKPLTYTRWTFSFLQWFVADQASCKKIKINTKGADEAMKATRLL